MTKETLVLYSAYPSTREKQAVGQHVLNVTQHLPNVDFVLICQKQFEDLYKRNPNVLLLTTFENVYDFGNFGIALTALKHMLNQYVRIIFLNDSVVGPFYPKEDWTLAFSEAGVTHDMVGVTDNWEYIYHIQSYCYALSTRAALFAHESNLYQPCLSRNMAVHREIMLTKFMKHRFQDRCKIITKYIPNIHHNFTLGKVRREWNDEHPHATIQYTPQHYIFMKYDADQYELDPETKRLISRILR